ncbi:MAG: glycosyltransferase [Actinomycetia bacterium]|nr:glycosyltransferase [Actinomycetes bacterium]
MKHPLVSIITPAYNSEKFISTCIESVINQTYRYWEQIIIDDGSDDRTPEIISRYNDKRIKYFKQKNLGIHRLHETYNKALNISEGSLIAILEGDDYWPLNKLEKQIPVFENNEIILSWGRGLQVNENNEIIEKIRFHNLSRSVLNNYPIGIAINKLLLDNFISPSSTIMIRKNSLMSIGGFKQYPNSYCVDLPTWLELALKGRFFYKNELLGYWRRHPDQNTNRRKIELIKNRVRYKLYFVDSLDAKQRNKLKIKRKIIEAKHHIQMGRFFILNKKRKEARKEFILAFQKGSFTLKLKAILGMMVSCFRRTNIEYLNKMFVKIKNSF